MASEYLKKLAQNEKPREKRELTPEEKRRNWWDYHRLHVIIAAVLAVVAAVMIWDIFIQRDPVPDYQIAYIGSTYLPADTASSLETALAELGEDLNGDGRVLVKVKEYPLFAADTNFQTVMAAQVQLNSDVTNCESFFFLMEDPALFSTQFELLAYPDGSVPTQWTEPDEAMWYAWTDCPVLMGLPLGSYTEYTVEGTITGDNQQVLAPLYIARRSYDEWDTFHYLDGCTALWQKLLEGAAE